ncbi:MAG: FHA domain-containing protein [Caldisericia bacterium]|nr:FHA domain-containing protein [Caldisericia bacterium]MDD4614502.1 FHA domain-containing protein [Caldisericia bacterium]
MNSIGLDSMLSNASILFASYFFIVIVVILYLALHYVIVSYALQRIGYYLDHPYPWTSWYYKLLMVLQLSERPWWWLFLFILLPGFLGWIPYINLFVGIFLLILWCILLSDMLKRIDSPSWWSILLLLPIVNLILYLVICNQLTTKDQLLFAADASSPPENGQISSEDESQRFVNKVPPKKNSNATLTIIQGDNMGKGYRLDANTIYIIGRAGNIVLPINDKTASREHSRIRYENDAFVLYDLGSTNKTRINTRIVSRKVLIDGDEICTGRTLFRFQWKRQ